MVPTTKFNLLKNLIGLLGMALGAASCAERIFDNPADPNNPSSSFTVRRNYPAPGDTRPTGMDFEDQELWIADRQRPRLVKARASGGQSLGAFPLASIAFGVTHDEALLWVTEPGSLARVFRNDTLMKDRQIPIPTSDPRGLDYDSETRTLWVIDGVRSVILEVDPNGPILREIPCGQAAQPGGLTFRDNELWIVDQQGSRLVQLDRADGHELASFTLPIGNAVGLTSDNDWFYYSEQSGRIFAVELKEQEARLRRPPDLSIAQVSGTAVRSGLGLDAEEGGVRSRPFAAARVAHLRPPARVADGSEPWLAATLWPAGPGALVEGRLAWDAEFRFGNPNLARRGVPWLRLPVSDPSGREGARTERQK